jgi:hypothetical protein
MTMKNYIYATTFIILALTACSKKDDKDPAPGERIAVMEDFNDSAKSIIKPGSISFIKDGYFILSYTSDFNATLSALATKNIYTAQDSIQSVEIAVTHTSGHKYDKVGLLFTASDVENFLSIQIGDKEYRIFRKVNGQGVNIVEWTAHSAIKGNFNDVNKIKVVKRGGMVSFYINDQKVYEAPAGTLATLDRIGLQAYKASFEMQTCTFKIDYIKALK